MAVYRIFAEKDATIYSAYPTVNTGRDAILAISNTDTASIGLNTGVTRALVKFTTSEINDFITNTVGNASYSASLRLFLANADIIPTSFTLECFPISGAWDMGTGKYGDIPINTSGVTWQSRTLNGVNRWQTSSFPAGVTASFTSGAEGGANWYFTSSTYGTSIRATQSFEYNDTLDVNINITNQIKEFLSGNLTNDGHLLKFTSSIENTSTYGGLNLFSMDTRTIYPPCLEIKWRDYSFNTGSSTRSTVTATPIVVTLDSNQYKYVQGAIQRFRLNVRPQYPVRQFTTSSVYLNNYYLPTGSYYQIRDEKTGEIVVDFDNNFTQISADSTSNYFDIYTYGLQPQRYYTIYIKTTIDSSTVILGQNSTFKIVI